MNIRMETTNSTQTPWSILHIRNVCFILMGIVLLVYPAQVSALHTGLLAGLLLLAGLSTALLGLRMRHLKQQADIWLILSSLRDLLFGIFLFTQLSQPLQTTLATLGFWAIVFAFLQSVEAMYYFLGTRSAKASGYWIEITHFTLVLVAGAFAFMLVMRPESSQSELSYVGLFPIGIGILLGLLTLRLTQTNA